METDDCVLWTISAARVNEPLSAIRHEGPELIDVEHVGHGALSSLRVIYSI